MNQIDRRKVLKIGGLGAIAAHGAGLRAQQEEQGGREGSKQARGSRRQGRAAAPRKVTGVLAVAPSPVNIGEEFEISLKVLTAPFTPKLSCFTRHYPTVSSSTNVSPRGISYMDNVPPKWEGTLSVSAEKGYSGPKEVVFDGGQGPYSHDPRPIKKVGPYRIDEPGLHFITFTDSATGVTASTNPIWVSDKQLEERLYWGDIHGHTIFTDGIRSPEEVYFFARDEAFLDVCALSDHTEFYLTDRQWDYLSNVTNDFYQPSRFVTLIAQEWTNFRLGHRNIYHPGDAAPIIRATDPVWGKLPKLFEFARQHGALVVPHHPAAAAMGADWSLEHDPEVERLVEIYSCWGNSERSSGAGNLRPIAKELGGEKEGSFVVDALQQGRRYGIIASGDVHDGRMGDALHGHQAQPPNYIHSQPGGLVGIWAQELTREAVFEALWNRRVYGTTGARIQLEFSIADRPMGSMLKGKGEMPVKVKAASEVPIVRLELVRNGEDHLAKEFEAQEANWEANIVPLSPSDSYYVRVTRTDGQMAWSSPIWVEAP